MKNRIIGVMATILSLLVTTAPVLAWYVDIYADVEDASAIIIGAGSDSGEEIDYGLSSTAGIINGNGGLEIYGEGYSDAGYMYTIVGGSGANGDSVFATQDLGVTFCQECPPCEVDTYLASSSVEVGGAERAEIFMIQGAGVEGPITEAYPVSGQIVFAKGKGETVNVDMEAARIVEDEQVEYHAMGGYGVNTRFKAFGYQGVYQPSSQMYGRFFFKTGYGQLPDGCYEC